MAYPIYYKILDSIDRFGDVYVKSTSKNECLIVQTDNGGDVEIRKKICYQEDSTDEFKMYSSGFTKECTRFEFETELKKALSIINKS